MRTLHYIDRLEPTRLFSATAAVERATTDSEFADVVIAYRSGEPGEMPQGVKVCKVKSRREWLTLLYDEMPDIVHVHCQWSGTSSSVIKSSQRRGFRVVVSVNNEPHAIRRFLPLRRCERVITGSEEEKKGNLLMRLANKRVSVLPHTLLNKEAEEGAADAAQQVWQKIIDKHLERNITVSTWQALFTLLRTAMCKDSQGLRPNSGIPTQEEVKNLQLLSDTDWRNLKLYSDKRGITDIVAEGIYALSIDTKGTEFPRGEQDKAEPKTTDELCQMLQRLKKEYKGVEGSLPLLIQLFKTVRDNDFDEKATEDELRAKGLKKFTLKIQDILQEHFGLEEGFLPVKNNNKGEYEYDY